MSRLWKPPITTRQHANVGSQLDFWEAMGLEAEAAVEKKPSAKARRVPAATEDSNNRGAQQQSIKRTRQLQGEKQNNKWEMTKQLNMQHRRFMVALITSDSWTPKLQVGCVRWGPA